jgi:hypothetical protein
MNRPICLLLFAAALAALLASCRRAPEAGTAAANAAAETAAAPSPAVDIEGIYEGGGTTLDGQTYSCEVKFMPAKQVYWVERYVGDIPMVPGVGILWGKLFVVGFRDERERYAVIAYEVKPDGSLEGTSAYQGSTKTGAETLKKK